MKKADSGMRSTTVKKRFSRFFSIGIWLVVSFFFIATLWPYRLIKAEMTYGQAVKSVSCGGEERTLTAVEQKQLFNALQDIRFIRISELGSYQKTEDIIEIKICRERSFYYYELIITEEDAFIYDELKQLREKASPPRIKSRYSILDGYYYPVVLCDDSLTQIRDILIK